MIDGTEWTREEIIKYMVKRTLELADEQIAAAEKQYGMPVHPDSRADLHRHLEQIRPRRQCGYRRGELMTCCI